MKGNGESRLKIRHGVLYTHRACYHAPIPIGSTTKLNGSVRSFYNVDPLVCSNFILWCLSQSPLKTSATVFFFFRIVEFIYLFLDFLKYFIIFLFFHARKEYSNQNEFEYIINKVLIWNENYYIIFHHFTCTQSINLFLSKNK